MLKSDRETVHSFMRIQHFEEEVPLICDRWLSEFTLFEELQKVLGSPSSVTKSSYFPDVLRNSFDFQRRTADVSSVSLERFSAFLPEHYGSDIVISECLGN